MLGDETVARRLDFAFVFVNVAYRRVNQFPPFGRGLG